MYTHSVSSKECMLFNNRRSLIILGVIVFETGLSVYWIEIEKHRCIKRKDGGTINESYKKDLWV